jgi:LmbE family N-acetylglucosaminyl deacetylase
MRSMKYKIYFQPWIGVLLLGCTAGASFVALLICPQFYLVFVVLGTFYAALFALSSYALWRCYRIERWIAWDKPQRLLILAPHQDDCVISAGGIGVRNIRLGGSTLIAYLTADEDAEVARKRAAEAEAAWKIAGLGGEGLRHLDILPPLRRRDPECLRSAQRKIRSIVDEFGPTVIIMPMFEGGHIHHDMVAALIGTIVTPHDRFTVFEAPEYSPYLSLYYTPHKIIALCSRWLFGLISYYGPPDGIDGRRIQKLRLTPEETEIKRRMLAAFVSQNAPSLVLTRSYPDRLAIWESRYRRRRPFDSRLSYLRLALAADRWLPTKIVRRLFQIELGTIGREGELTDWRDEWNGRACN